MYVFNSASIHIFLIAQRQLSRVFQRLPKGLGDKIKPGMQEMQVWSLDAEDPLEKEMTTQYSFIAGEIPWTEEPGRL